MMKKTIKILAVALATAATITMPLSAEAHWLSSAQEKEIGTKAANDFARENPVRYDPILEHIQKRLMMFNSNKLWMYGTAGKKRGLEPVLRAQNEYANAVSYGGGQIFIFDGMFDYLATKETGHFYYNQEAQHPWKKSNIYQMSAMAAVMGHEMGHWENEDMLRQYDKQMDTKLIGVLIPTGNIWQALGVAVGTNIANAFNSRQMGFETEQQADEKAMEYAMEVPEYSIGGQAIVEYREYMFKITRGEEDKVTNWLHPHSKAGKRLERALEEQERQSKGYIQWNELAPSYNGYQCGEAVFYSTGKRDFDPTERAFYVSGQIATAIHFDICKDRCMRVEREDLVFTDGSPNNVVLILEGRGNDLKDHKKIIDTYYGISLSEAKQLVETPFETVESKLGNVITNNQNSEISTLAFTRMIISTYEKNKPQYAHKKVED